MKKVPIIVCGVFRWELEKIRPEIEQELGIKFENMFMPPALDVSDDKLASAVKNAVDALDHREPVLLYGSACHSDMERLADEVGAPPPRGGRNCAELLLSPKKKHELDAEGNPYYLTLGGLKLWKKIYREAHNWDEADALVNFGGCDRIIVLDSGATEYTEDEIFEFFEYTHVPVEVVPIDLDYFTGIVKDLCQRHLATQLSD
jgi:hypothetical protein